MDALPSPRRRRLLLGALGTLAVAGCGDLGPRAGRAAPLARFAGETMGSTYNVKIAHVARPADELAQLHAAVRSALDGVDLRMSLYRGDSEVSLLNRHVADAPFALSPDLFDVLVAARAASELSAGAFDVTVEPMVNAWGFGPAAIRGVPPATTVRERLHAVDYRALRLDTAARTAMKGRADLRIDLGGIAAGFGVDLAARALDERGVEHYMLEVGGEVRARGLNATGEAWRIGIEQPDTTPRRARIVVPLHAGALATSGDYRNYFEHDGRRYSHEIDPRTGRPIEHALCAVTVVAGDAMRADALSTALIVLGPERGLALGEKLGLAAYFIVREPDGRLRDLSTPAFRALGPIAA